MLVGSNLGQLVERGRRTGHRKSTPGRGKRGFSELGSGVKEKHNDCSTVNETENGVRKLQS